MTNDRMLEGMKEMLRLLPEDEIAGLLKTITSSLVPYREIVNNDGVKVDARTHAINSILMYSDTIGVLNKQRMKKTYIAQYLNLKGTKMTMPATKHTLCNDVLKYWGGNVPENINIIDDEPNNRPSSQSPKPSIKSEGKPDLRNPSSPHPSTSQECSTPALAQSQSQQSLVPASAQQLIEIETAASLRQKEAQEGQKLGQAFAVWFYERLNTLTDFTAAHFWPECNFRLEFIFTSQPNHTIVDSTTTSEECCAKLKDLIAVNKLYFNLNEPTGIRGTLNPHGLAQIMVCGTLHERQNSNPLGVFEQMFGLMKDPSLGNNFKIKFTILRLREGNLLAVQNRPPELCDSSLVGIIEEMDD